MRSSPRGCKTCYSTCWCCGVREAVWLGLVPGGGRVRLCQLQGNLQARALLLAWGHCGLLADGLLLLLESVPCSPLTEKMGECLMHAAVCLMPAQGCSPPALAICSCTDRRSRERLGIHPRGLTSTPPSLVLSISFPLAFYLFFLKELKTDQIL